MSAQKQKGFTLIELLVVISIIGILSIIGLVAYTTFLKNARDAKRQSDLKFIQSALEEYHSDQHYYPSGTTLDSPFTNASGAPSGTTVTKTYLTTVPKDPDQSTYSYVARPAVSPPYVCDNAATKPCTSYCLYAKIEGNAPTSDSGCTPTTPYTYGITRP